MSTIEEDPEGFGIDFDSLTDFPANFAIVSGKPNLANAIGRRLITKRGSLPNEPDYGFSLLEKINGDFTPAELRILEGEIRAECRKDERVQDADITVAFDTANERMSIGIVLETEDNDSVEFTLIIGIADLTIDIYREGQTIPAQPTPATAPVVVTVPQAGPPGPAGPTGSQGPAGSGGGGSGLVLDDLEEYEPAGASEELLREFTLPDQSALDATLTIDWTSVAKVTGGTGKIRVRVGGTQGAVDGTIVATIDVTETSYTLKSGSGSFTNPNADTFIKITGENPAAQTLNTRSNTIVVSE